MYVCIYLLTPSSHSYVVCMCGAGKDSLLQDSEGTVFRHSRTLFLYLLHLQDFHRESHSHFIKVNVDVHGELCHAFVCASPFAVHH